MFAEMSGSRLVTGVVRCSCPSLFGERASVGGTGGAQILVNIVERNVVQVTQRILSMRRR